MKKSIGFLVAAMVVFFLAASGCTNLQSTKRSEAEMAVAALPDFQKQLYYANISSGKAPAAPFMFNSPFIYDEYPVSELMYKMGNKESFVHQIIYQTTDGDFCLVFLSDDRPLAIIKKIYMRRDGTFAIPSLEK